MRACTGPACKSIHVGDSPPGLFYLKRARPDGERGGQPVHELPDRDGVLERDALLADHAGRKATLPGNPNPNPNPNPDPHPHPLLTVTVTVTAHPTLTHNRTLTLSPYPHQDDVANGVRPPDLYGQRCAWKETGGERNRTLELSGTANTVSKNRKLYNCQSDADPTQSHCIGDPDSRRGVNGCCAVQPACSNRSYPVNYGWTCGSKGAHLQHVSPATAHRPPAKHGKRSPKP